MNYFLLLFLIFNSGFTLAVECQQGETLIYRRGNDDGLTESCEQVPPSKIPKKAEVVLVCLGSLGEFKRCSSNIRAAVVEEIEGQSTDASEPDPSNTNLVPSIDPKVLRENIKAQQETAKQMKEFNEKIDYIFSIPNRIVEYVLSKKSYIQTGSVALIVSYIVAQIVNAELVGRARRHEVVK